MYHNLMATDLRELTKAYGKTVAVDHLCFDVYPGRVNGFLQAGRRLLTGDPAMQSLSNRA
jgi:hypothetical protein